MGTLEHSGISTLEYSGISTLEYSGMGTLEHSGISTLEYSGISTLEYSGMGTLEHSGIIPLEYSGISTLEYSSIDTVYQSGIEALMYSMISNYSTDYQSSFHPGRYDLDYISLVISHCLLFKYFTRQSDIQNLKPSSNISSLNVDIIKRFGIIELQCITFCYKLLSGRFSHYL